VTARHRALLDKAVQPLDAARRALGQDDTETAADRAYYAVYYSAWSLLDLEGAPRPKTHNSLIAEFSRRYVKTGRIDVETGAILSRLQSLRLIADYTPEPIPPEDARRAILEAERLIALAREWGAG
jgi:uncharacterized protein (UPF0332 family)